MQLCYDTKTMNIDFVFSILILVFSVVVHEVSHGLMAYSLGDNTAKLGGRLTLNPLKHLEWFGSFFLPVITYFSGGFILGWAKPVPFNPYNLRDQRWGEAKVALAGPLSNFSIAIFFGMFLRYAPQLSMGQDLFMILNTIVVTNLALGTFNLVPIPPLDGSKVLFSLMPYSMINIREWFEKNSLVLMLIFIFFLWQVISPIIRIEYNLITGFGI